MGNGWPFLFSITSEGRQAGSRCGAILGNGEELNKVDPVGLEAVD
jgi:hypothetical protein